MDRAEAGHLPAGATREYAPHLARAATAVGIDALFLEVHPDPANAWSDAAAQLTIPEAIALLRQIHRVREAVSNFPA